MRQLWQESRGNLIGGLIVLAVSALFTWLGTMYANVGLIPFVIGGLVLLWTGYLIYLIYYWFGKRRKIRLTSGNTPFEPETILIPAGPFLMGRQPGKDVPDNETPQHEVNLPAYQIGKYPVTNEQYAKFVEQNPERRPERVAGWRFTKPPQEKLNHPVVGVSWQDALAYCEWLSQKTGRKYRLPTEAEWEKAARGDKDCRIYPWGNELAPDYCNYNSTQITPVDQYEAGQSPYGCYDMVGNVWEWTSTLWGEDWRKATFTYPYQHDNREELNITTTVYRIYRGGAYNDEVARLGCSARGCCPSSTSDNNLGFRIVLDVRNQFSL